MTDGITPNFADVRRVLVVKLRHLGDVLLTTPVYRAIKKACPNAEITACVFKGTEEMLDNNPDVKNCMTVPKSRAFEQMRQQGNFLADLRRARFDLAIDLTGSDRAAILTRLTGARLRWGPARKKGFLGKKLCYTQTVIFPRNVHVVEQQKSFLNTFGIENEKPELFFFVSDENRSAVRKLVGSETDLVHVHPVSRIMKKCWPAPFMATFLNSLGRRGLKPVLTASPDPVELNFIKDLVPLLEVPHFNLSAKLSLSELGALSEASRLFVGVDSAPMHIAAAVGTPVIGIFGPSSETLWAPWCEKKLVLSRALPCRLPCKNKRSCPHIECLRAMTPEMVMPQVDRFLSTIL
jgi:heptosyltransferase-3